jgi:Kelch motif protein
MNRFRIIAMTLSFLFLGHLVEAQVPQILNYQGRVAVNGTNFDGTGLFQFALVNGTGSSTYWSNGNSLVSLPVSAGLYSVALGDATVSNMAAIPAGVFTNIDVRLRVSFNGGMGLQQLSPDQRFTAVGYALMAASVPNGAITSSQLATGAVTAVTLANGAVGTGQLAAGAVTSVNIASNTITSANMAPGAGVVPSGAIVLSQTASNSSLVAAGFAPFSTNVFVNTSWSEATAAASWSARANEAAVAFNGQMWLFGGFPGGPNKFDDVWSTSNGTNWTQAIAVAPWSARSSAAGVAFNGQMWVLGGAVNGGNGVTNDVWSTSNGTNWTQVTAAAPWSSRYVAGTIVFNGQLWLLGGGTAAGYTNDVWSTFNGTNWTQMTAAAPWPSRYMQGAVAFNGQMWVLGGYNGTYYNDVWSTSNGTNWAQVTAAAPWSPRYGAAVFVFNGQMWVVGGQSGVSSFYNDVWSTSDGTNWTQVAATSPWNARAALEFASVVFNGQMWLLGGYGSSGALNDVWYGQGPSALTNSVPVQLGQFYLFQKQ